MGEKPPKPPFGRLLKYRRQTLGISQEALAQEAEVSTRHLSYVENGRSVPSREMVLAVACALEVDEVGLFLEAAGYLAPYPDIDLDAPQMRDFANELRSVVDRQAHPAFMHNRFGTILNYNRLFESVIRCFTEKPVSADKAQGHDLLDAVRPYIENWDQVAALYRRRLFRELVRGSGDVPDEILEQLYGQLAESESANEAVPPPFTPLILKGADVELRFDFVTVTLGTPQDIGLRNYRMVQFLPADDGTRARVATWLAEGQGA